MSASAAASAFGMLNREPNSMKCGIAHRTTFSAPIQPGTCTVRERFLIPSTNLSTANSSGYVLLANGIPVRTRPNTGCASAPRTMSVSTKVMCATPTRTPRCLSSGRSVSPSASTPALETLYDASPGMCTIAAREETSSR